MVLLKRGGFIHTHTKNATNVLMSPRLLCRIICVYFSRMALVLANNVAQHGFVPALPLL